MSDETPYRVDVQENGHSNWISNQLRYATADEARSSGIELMSRWFGIQDYRVVDERTETVVSLLPAGQP